MSKYDLLSEYLSQAGGNFVPMRFGEIEDVLGFQLPSSARNHRAWWSNNTSNSVMTDAWLNAGYKSESVDMTGERLVFRRVRREPGMGGHGATEEKHAHQSIIGALEGTVTFNSGVDLTEPLGVAWGADR